MDTGGCFSGGKAAGA